MNEADAIDIVQSAIWTVVAACGPAVGGAMLIGMLIALFQALTQIQEVTLTFVPKILAIFVIRLLGSLQTSNGLLSPPVTIGSSALPIKEPWFGTLNLPASRLP